MLDRSHGVPPPIHTHTSARVWTHKRPGMQMRMHAQTNLRAHVGICAQAHAHAHKQLDAYLLCELSSFYEEFGVLARKEILFDKKKIRKKIRIDGATRI